MDERPAAAISQAGFETRMAQCGDERVRRRHCRVIRGGPSWLSLTAAFCISGGQKSVIALSAIYYSTSIRSTGVGWALGIGRLGGIGGPLLIGVLLAWQLSAQHILYAAAIPMLMAGLLVALLGRWYGATASRA